MPPLNLLLKSQAIEQVLEHRHLGVIIDDQLKWQANTNCITNTIAKMCICYLVSDTFLTLRLAEHSFMHILCLEKVYL